MSRYFYEDFIYEHYDLIEEADRLSDLPDHVIDQATYIWLNKYTSWHTDIYPASFSSGVCKIATEMLFGKAPSHSRIVSNLFIAMAEDSPDSDSRDDTYLSEALGYFDDKVHLGNFADDVRDSIYLYLENSMEEELFDQFVNLKARDKYEHFEE
jgi:hypothetical protein